MNALEKVRSLHDELAAAAVAPKAAFRPAEAWGLAERLLSRMTTQQAEIARICRERDLAGLDAMLSSLENPGARPPAPGPEVDPAEMDRALRAFRKRFKLMRLADESKLGGRYTTGGRQSKIDAIQPPDDFPASVWRALEAAGKLRHTGQGFYVEPDAPASNA